MNTDHPTPNPTGDPVDRLLSAFYRAEMPKNWPAVPNARTEPAHAKLERANTSTRSRWALAASVAMLLGGCWYLSGQMTDGKKHANINFDGGSADSKFAKDAGKDKAKTP
jgi:hypothetical protein